MIKYSKELEWLEPYVEQARTFIPNMDRLQAIQKIPLKKDKKHRVYGTCTQDENSYYIIRLYLEYNHTASFKPLKFQRKKFSRMDILLTLAHELTHMVFWDHCPRRQILESQIAIMFMARLHFDGYISEEHELSSKV